MNQMTNKAHAQISRNDGGDNIGVDSIIGNDNGYDDAQHIQVKILAASEAAAENFMVDWDLLSRNSSEPNIFYSSALCKSAINNLSEFKNIRFFTLWDNDKLIALIPLKAMQKYSRWPLPHYQNAQHPNSFLGTPIIWQGYEILFWQEFLDHCHNEIPILNFLYLDKLSLEGPIFEAFQTLCNQRNQHFDIVQECERAKLETSTPSDAYYAQNIRKKKRKEIQRLRNRLDELGTITFHESLAHQKSDTEVKTWLEEFLSLENAGWKGDNASSLASNSDTHSFYWDAMKAAHKNEQLHLSCMRLNGEPLAMLITLIDGDVGFSFKTAFDENYARYSPGVLLQLENLSLQKKHGLKFIDSCAAENHPMIDKIWSERRRIGSISIGLSGVINTLYFKLLRFAEQQMDKRNKDNNRNGHNSPSDSERQKS